MGAHFQISPGPVGGGAANASYITRTAAAEEGDEVYHNAPESVENARDWREMKINFRAWAEQVKAEEVSAHGNRKGQPRTHYRMVISYEEKIPTEAVQEDVQEFLEEEFPDARAVGVVHQDTEKSHAHIWMSARKLDGKKVQIGDGDLQTMHATMDEIYERRMDVQSRNAEKIEETSKFKREYAKKRARGASEEELRQWAEANRPNRATPPDPEVYRERERRLEAQQEAVAGAGRRPKRSFDKLKEKRKRLEEAVQEMEQEAQEETLEEKLRKWEAAMRGGDLKRARQIHDAAGEEYGPMQTLEEDQRHEVINLQAELLRREKGTQDAYEKLTRDEKLAVRFLEREHSGAEGVSREDLGEHLAAISDSSEDLLKTADRIAHVLPNSSDVRQALKDAEEVAQYRINTRGSQQRTDRNENQDVNKEQGRDRGKGGRDRGRGR